MGLYSMRFWLATVSRSSWSGARISDSADSDGSVSFKPVVCADISDSRDWTRSKEEAKCSPMLEYEAPTVEESAASDVVCAAW